MHTLERGATTIHCIACDKRLVWERLQPRCGETSSHLRCDRGAAVEHDFTLRELLITLFLFLTAPVSAQLLAKAAFATDPTSRPPAVPDDEMRR